MEIFKGATTKPSDYRDDSRRVNSKIKKPRGEYKFGKRVNRLELKTQIKPLFEDGYKKLRYNQHYGRITIEEEVKENGKVRKVRKEIGVVIEFSLNHPCFLYVRDEEDLEYAYRKVLDALSGR